MADGVVLSSDRGDSDDRLVTQSGVLVRDAQLLRSEAILDFDSAFDLTSLRRVVMTQDGANAYTPSVSGDYLNLTAAAAGGNQREAYLFPNSLATDSEIDTVLGPANTLAAGEGQWGNLHAVTQDADGLWHGVACWTDTTLAIVPLLNFGVVTFSGAATMQINNLGNNSVEQALNSVRHMKAILAVRASNVVTLTFNSDRLPPVGSTGDFAGNTVTTFHATGATVTAVDRARRTLSYAQVAGDATDASAGGTWSPQTRYASNPIRLCSRLRGNVLSGFTYHQEEGKPDWSDSRVTSYTLSGGPPFFESLEGLCGLWAAHCTSGNVLRFGQSRWKRLR